jgi:hypothetical protein
LIATYSLMMSTMNKEKKKKSTILALFVLPHTILSIVT